MPPFSRRRRRAMILRMSLDIRHATSDDVVDIAALLRELGYPQRVDQIRVLDRPLHRHQA